MLIIAVVSHEFDGIHFFQNIDFQNNSQSGSFPRRLSSQSPDQTRPTQNPSPIRYRRPWRTKPEPTKLVVATSFQIDGEGAMLMPCFTTAVDTHPLDQRFSTGKTCPLQGTFPILAVDITPFAVMKKSKHFCDPMVSFFRKSV